MNSHSAIIKALWFIWYTAASLSIAQPPLPPFLQHASTWAQKTIETLSLREKIGQLFIVPLWCDDGYLASKSTAIDTATASVYTNDPKQIEALIRDYHVGGVIFLGSSTLAHQITLTNHYQNISTIPLLIAQDCEWGLTMRIPEAIRYPRALTLGAITDLSLIYEIGKEIGIQCKAIGVHLNCAPVADINNNPYNPVINDRSFGEDTHAVTVHSVAFMRGMQDAGILACAKHFPGHGDTTTDSHEQLPCIPHSLERLYHTEFVPFIAHIIQGVSCIMLAHLEIPALEPQPGRPSSMSPAVVTQTLGNTLQFQGLKITDAMGMRAILNHYKPGYAEFEAILAGNDCIVCPLDVPTAITLVEDALQKGMVTEADINQRVLKILQAKEYLNLHNNRLTSLEDALQIVHRPAARALHNKLYRAAITTVVTPAHNNILDTLFSSPTQHLPIIIRIGATDNNHPLKKQYPDILSIDLAHTFTDELLVKTIEQVGDTHTVIVEIHSSNKHAKQNFGIKKNSILLVQKLRALQKKIILILFANPSSRALFDQVDACIYAYEDLDTTQQAVADVLHGLLPSAGKLPINPNLLTNKSV